MKIDQFYLYRKKALKYLGTDQGAPLFESYERSPLSNNDWISTGKMSLYPTIAKALSPIPPPA